jgi:hypothetical protein
MENFVGKKSGALMYKATLKYLKGDKEISMNETIDKIWKCLDENTENINRQCGNLIETFASLLNSQTKKQINPVMDQVRDVRILQEKQVVC